MGEDGLIIVGGVAAGLAAAMEARRASPGLRITVLERTGDISYGACGLPYVVGGLIDSPERLVIHTPEYFRERHDIEVRLRAEALEVLPAKSVVRVREDGVEREVGYDALVLATGAAAVCPPLPGHDLEGVFVLRHMRDGLRMLRFIGEARPRAAVVVGAGYIGLEMAEAFRARGMNTTLVEASDKVMTSLGGRARDIAADEMRANGVEVLFGERAAGFEGDGRGRVARVLTESGRAVEADIVSIGVGVRPEVALARGAGLEVGESGAVVTDERQRTSAPGVYAAGDCCEVLHRVSGRKVWNPLGQPAVRQGWVVGANAARGDSSDAARYAGVVGTNAVKLFGLELARTGLSLEEAAGAGFDAEETEAESHTRAGYYPGASRIHTRLVADRRGRLLGAQLVGREGVAQRVNVYAAALHAGMRVEDVERLDLAYAPPFAPTIDPIIRAAHKALKKD
ncbi:MAG TPA: FAD-dependent oxidoreductase [Pyrinomonadaceae bacterium]|nr:FAD-dependent oxidoreductase [Pyrinomonadaceae bacterium]